MRTWKCHLCNCLIKQVDVDSAQAERRVELNPPMPKASSVAWFVASLFISLISYSNGLISNRFQLFFNSLVCSIIYFATCSADTCPAVLCWFNGALRLSQAVILEMRNKPSCKEMFKGYWNIQKPFFNSHRNLLWCKIKNIWDFRKIPRHQTNRYRMQKHMGGQLIW